jgi:hemolysin activation/secretion protein
MYDPMNGWCQDRGVRLTSLGLGLATVVVGWVGSIPDAVAQLPSTPAPITPTAPPTPPAPLPSELLPPPDDFLRLPEGPPLSPSVEPNPSQTITVTTFEVVGSTLFTMEQLQAATASFLNRPLRFEDLLKARAAITKLYVDQGYLTSGAYLPANQDVSKGVVTFQVLEGSIEEIRITGTKSLRPRYIRDRLQSAIHPPLNIPRLTSALQLLKQNPLIEGISAELLPGTQPGTNLLAVSIIPAPSRTAHITLNNHRSATSGEFGRQIRFSQTNLTGYGDRFSANYTNTAGGYDFNLNYALPVNAKDGTFSVSYGQSDSNVIQKPFSALDINSSSRNLTVAFRQPVINTPSHQIVLGAALSRQESELTFLDGIPLSLPNTGSDAQGRIRVTQLNLFQEWTQRRRRSLLTLRSDLDIGLDLGATQNPTAPDGRYVKWQGLAQLLYGIHPDTILTLRSTVQLSDRALPNSSLLGLGGNRALRGYPEGFLLFDQAVFGTAEIAIPIFRTEDRSHRLYLSPFVDLGYGWNYRRISATDNRFLIAPGLGLRYEWTDRVSVQINWGIPLVGVPADKITPGIEDSRVLFSIDVKLF